MSKNYHSLPGSSRQQPNGSQCNSCSTHSSVSSYTYNNASYKLTLASCLVKMLLFQVNVFNKLLPQARKWPAAAAGCCFFDKT